MRNPSPAGEGLSTFIIDVRNPNVVLLKMLISVDLIVVFEQNWFDGCCKLHVKIEDVYSEGQRKEYNNNNCYYFKNK